MVDAPDGGPEPTEDRLLPWKKVKDLTGLSRTTAWRLQKAGDFPLPVAISPGRVGWRESEVRQWQVSRAPRSGTAAPHRPQVRSFAAELAPPSTPAAKSEKVPAGKGNRVHGGPRRSPDQITFDF